MNRGTTLLQAVAGCCNAPALFKRSCSERALNSRPFGQHNAPSSRKNLAKYSSRASGRVSAVSRARSSVKSHSPALPSLKASLRTLPRTNDAETSLIIIRARNALQWFEILRPLPVGAQLGAVILCPLAHQTVRFPRQASFQYDSSLNLDQRLVALVLDVKVRRTVVGMVHADIDTEKVRDYRHYKYRDIAIMRANLYDRRGILKAPVTPQLAHELGGK